MSRSYLTRELLKDWAWDQMSAVKLQRLAEAGVRDGASHPELLRMAKIGGRGSQTARGNAQRDLIRHFCKKEAHYLIHKLEGSLVDTCVMPHEFMHFLYTHFPLQFSARMGAVPAFCKNFWEQYRATEKGAEMFRIHPHLRNQEHLEFCIPLWIHCDAGPISKKLSA